MILSGSSLGSDDVIPEPQEGNTVTLYGQWATFEPVAADWGTGSITLKATGVSLKEGEDFFLSYCDASAAESDGAHWDYVEDLNKTTDGTGVSFTDTQFSSRLGGIPAVRYRLQIGKSKDDVRATMCCTTRNRHGMFIGFSQYDRKYWRKLAGKQGFYNDARDFRSTLVEKGGFSEGNAHFVANNTATTNGIRQMMHKCASDVLPGDLFVFYIATHGGGYRTKVFSLDGDDGAVVTESGLAVYDGMYKAQHLLEDVRKFPAGTAVVNIIKSCHSYEMTGGVDPRGGVNEWLVDCGFGQCLGNVAWITDCDARQSSYTVPEELHSRFGIPFILDGLNGGYADMRLHGTEYAGGNTDGMITFGEIGRYAREFYKGLSDDDPSNVQLENEPLLDRIIVGTRTFMPSMTSPDVPVDVTARSRDMYTLIDWSKTSNATSYWIYRYPVDDPSEWKWIGVVFDNSYEDKTADLNKRYGYRVMALNSLGKSELSYVAEGLRGTNLYLEYLSSLLGISEASVDDWNTMEMATSMNGYTYKECYALGINPEDPNDDLKITDFTMEDGKPVITLNHTKDGSGNSFESRIKTLGKANLTDADWVDVTDKDQSAYRFFKVTVDLP